MSFFKYEDRSGQQRMHTGRIIGPASAGVVALTTLWNSFYVVEQREVGLEVMFGGVNEVNTEPGLYWKFPWPIERAIKYPLYRQRAEVTANEANLRTRDQMRVEGGIFVDYEIDEQSANIQNIYADLRGDKEDIKDAIAIRAKEAAVNAFGQFSSVDLTTKISDITALTKKLLQESIDKQGWPFKIKDVISNGVRLSPDSEQKLERVMAAEQEMTVLNLRERNAEKAEDVLRKEGKALGALIKELQETGIPDDQISNVVCLKMSNDADKIQVPFAPGCFNAEAGYPVAVDPGKVSLQLPSQRQPIPTP